MAREIRTHCGDEDLVAERREHILRSSTRLLCKKGFDRTSVREIASACGMSIGNLYHYVGNKEDILTLILQRAVSEMDVVAEVFASAPRDGDPATTLRGLMKMYIAKLDDIADITVFLYQETKNLSSEERKGIYDSEARTLAAVEQFLARGASTGDFQVANARLTAQNIVVIAQAWAFRRWELQKHYTLDEYVDHQAEFILSSMRPERRSGKTAGGRGL